MNIIVQVLVNARPRRRPPTVVRFALRIVQVVLCYAIMFCADVGAAQGHWRGWPLVGWFAATLMAYAFLLYAVWPLLRKKRP